MSTVLRGLEGKVALITGAGRGQGANHARGFAEAGCKVAVTDICEPIAGLYPTATKEQLDLTVRQIAERGAQAIGVIADVRDEVRMAEVVDEVTATLGPVDVLVNNAGMSTSAMLHEMTEDQWDAIVDINLKGQAITCKVVIPQMIGRRSGKIINISSGVINSGMTMLSNYVASKYGVVGLTKALATELAEFGINVNAIAPGTIRPTDDHGSGMLKSAVSPDLGMTADELYEMVCQQFNLPGDKWRVEMQDVTDAVLFLASDNARVITGAVLGVDGGQMTK